MMKQKAWDFEIKDIDGKDVSLKKYKGQKILLGFFRYAACPFCNLRVNELMHYHDQLKEKGMQIITFFHSTREKILEISGDRRAPFPIIADPERIVYTKYGVVNNSKLGVVKGMTLRMPTLVNAMSKGFMPSMPDEDMWLMPADFLIDADQNIDMAHYGTDIGDHIPLKKIRNWLDGGKISHDA
jgi:peroxiredoxin